MQSCQIPIVVSGYNRCIPLARVLSSLERARYPSREIPLYISLDAGGLDSTRKVADDFNWSHGPKHVLARAEHLGMREHAFACMSLLEKWDALIFLEDDSVVGRDFYPFCQAILGFMAKDETIFAASPYSFDFCEFDWLRFTPVRTDESCFLMQSATTWAVLFTRARWREFRTWYSRFSDTSEGKCYIPSQINQWPKTSWKKFINRYLSATGSFFLYPYVSYLTHYADGGTHFATASTNAQVPMVTNIVAKEQDLSCFSANMVAYDEFWEMVPPSVIVEQLGYDFEFDLRRIKRIDQYRKPFIITSRPVKKAITSFDDSMLPMEMNILERLPGRNLHLARAVDVLPGQSEPTPEEIRKYMKSLGMSREIGLALDGIKSQLRRRFW